MFTSSMYKGYEIIGLEDGDFIVGDNRFPTYDEAMEWIDSNCEESETSMPIPHQYKMFYVDGATDRCLETIITASSYREAKKLLIKDYDVYRIIAYDLIK